MQPTPDLINSAIRAIVSNELPEGGFRQSDMAPFCPEATAWAVLALKASGNFLDVAKSACNRLVTTQLPDGRVSAVEGSSDAAWPTPLCILAWKCFSEYRKSVEAGIDFLLGFTGEHNVKRADSPGGHDTSIVGWPWIEGTHSWIEPTSLAIIALRASGYADHPRTKEAVRMIMNRQLPSGGWNYGNTTVFGKELLPFPETTGQALCALGGITAEDSVAKSLLYMQNCFKHIRTPMAMAWMLSGLEGWSINPPGWQDAVIESVKLQNRYGPYSTVLLAQLLTVYYTSGKFMGILV